ncbi:MAG: hypothetical protein HY319_10525 [Armatimonadetes bacterium]|nr:hypothetical protein [Armatimonadota bacterium]
MERTLLVTANSPGEISGWLRPIGRAWQEVARGGDIVVILLPCTFASGREESVASRLPGVTEVIPTNRLLRFLVWEGRRFRGSPHLHLGGDLMYAALLSWRWGLRSWSYMWARRWWDSAFRGYFTRNQKGVDWLLRRRISRDKIHVVGDLVVDSVYAGDLRDPPPLGRAVSFLPGSRLHEVRGLAPFFLGVAEELRGRWPELEFRLLLSPFLDPAEVRRVVTAPPLPDVGGVQGTLQGESVLQAPGGTRLRLVQGGEAGALAGSRLVVTIPGTKTAEAACLGIPSCVILPLNRPERLPYGGLLGLLDWLPGGPVLKGRLLLRMKGKIGYLAQPNILAGRELVPELIEVLRPHDVAQAAGRMLASEAELERIRVELLEQYAPFRGAARRMVEVMTGSRP